MLQQASVIHSFLWSGNIQLYGYSLVCLSGPQITNISVITTFQELFGLPRTMLLMHIRLTRFYADLRVQFSWVSLYIGGDLWGHRVTLCSTFWGTAKLSPKVAAQFYMPTSRAWRFRFLHLLIALIICPAPFAEKTLLSSHLMVLTPPSLSVHYKCVDFQTQSHSIDLHISVVIMGNIPKSWLPSLSRTFWSWEVFPTLS